MSENKSEPSLGPLYVGAQNDALFIIDKPPRPSNDYPQHDAEVAAIAKIYHSGIPGREKAFADLFAAAPETKAQRDELLAALTAIGVLPDGYCFCFGDMRLANKVEHAHTGECQAARTAIRKAQGGGDE